MFVENIKFSYKTIYQLETRFIAMHFQVVDDFVGMKQSTQYASVICTCCSYGAFSSIIHYYDELQFALVGLRLATNQIGLTTAGSITQI